MQPRKLFYMAVDGCAPRAKMNQQRSRRFRSAQEREERQASKQALRAEFEAQGMTVPEEECVCQLPGRCDFSAKQSTKEAICTRAVHAQ